MINLRKLLFAVHLLLLITLAVPVSVSSFSNNVTKPELKKHYIVSQDSKEKLYKDIFITLLLPCLQKEVNNYYKEYLTEMPTVAPYDVPILRVDRVGGNGRYDFRLKLELHPYVGPHLDVGLDYITVRVNSGDKIIVEKFEHIKSYPLPWNWEHIIKK